MQIDFINLTLMITTFLWLTSLGYLFFSFIALELFKYKKDKKVISGNFSPPVTILKPIYGLDPGMLNCLRSFCQQDYHNYQVKFGLQDKNDPAIPIVKKLQAYKTKGFIKIFQLIFSLSCNCRAARLIENAAEKPT